MPRFATLPFTLRRSKDTFTTLSTTITTETVHGLLRLEGDELIAQWRPARKIDYVGFSIRTDEEFEAVREARIPISSMCVLWGAERNTEFVLGAEGEPPQPSDEDVCRAGDVAKVSPTIGDIHRVSNVSDRLSVSIHVYGANIGQVSRHVYDEETGEQKSFVSCYSSQVVPNIWS